MALGGSAVPSHFSLSLVWEARFQGRPTFVLFYVYSFYGICGKPGLDLILIKGGGWPWEPAVSPITHR